MFTNPGDIGLLAEKLQHENSKPFDLQWLPGLDPVLVGEDGINTTNRVLYFHGYGDSQDGMRAVAESLRLPQTASYILKGTETLPLGLEGRGWYPFSKILIDLYSDAVKRESEGRQSITTLIVNMIKNNDRLNCGTTYLTGHGQGAELCLWIASKIRVAGVVLLSLPVGSVIPTTAIGSPVCYHSSDPPPPSLKSLCTSLTITNTVKSLLPVAEWYSKRIALRLLSLDNDPSIIKVQPGTVEQLSKNDNNQ